MVVIPPFADRVVKPVILRDEASTDPTLIFGVPLKPSAKSAVPATSPVRGPTNDVAVATPTSIFGVPDKLSAVSAIPVRGPTNDVAVIIPAPTFAKVDIPDTLS